MPGSARTEPGTVIAQLLTQLSVTAVSSMTNEVCSEESSTPLNLSVTVEPAKRRDVEASEHVAGGLVQVRQTVTSVVVPNVTVSLSNCVVVVVSAVSMCA